MAKQRIFPKTPSGDAALEREIKRLQETIDRLEASKKHANPHWLEGMLRHYRKEYDRLVALRSPRT